MIQFICTIARELLDVRRAVVPTPRAATGIMTLAVEIFRARARDERKEKKKATSLVIRILRVRLTYVRTSSTSIIDTDLRRGILFQILALRSLREKGVFYILLHEYTTARQR